MVPPYERFMKPTLDLLATGETCQVAELSVRVAERMGLSDEARADRVAWDGMPVVEARLRKAVLDLSMAGLVARDGDRLQLTPEGRDALAELPRDLGVSELAARFPAYASYRAEFEARRGA